MIHDFMNTPQIRIEVKAELLSLINKNACVFYYILGENEMLETFTRENVASSLSYLDLNRY